MNTEVNSFRKTFLLVVLAHAGVAAIPLSWVSWKAKPIASAGPVAKVPEVQWLDPALPLPMALPAPQAEPVVATVAEPETPKVTKPVVTKPRAVRPQLGHVEKLPAKINAAPPQTVKFSTAPETDSKPDEPAVGNASDGTDPVHSAADDDALNEYHARLQRLLESHWQQPAHPASERPPVAKVAVTIHRDGTIESAKLAASSGFPEVDRSVLAAAHAVSHIEPLPSAVAGDSYQLIIRFVLH